MAKLSLPLYLSTPPKKNMQNRQISENCSILHEKAFLDEIGCADENVSCCSATWSHISCESKVRSKATFLPVYCKIM